MSITKPAAFGGKDGWEILSSIARHYATQDIDIARKLLAVTKYLQELENQPATSINRLDDIKDELIDIVEKLGDSEKVENLSAALKDKNAQIEELTASKEALREAYVETLEIVAEMKESLEGSTTSDLQDEVESLTRDLQTKKDELTRLIAKNADTEERFRKLRIAHKKLKAKKEQADAADKKEDAPSPEREPDNDPPKVSEEVVVREGS